MVIQKTPTKIDKIVSLKIGQRGENLATDIKMDVSDWITVHPDATYYCLFKRPDEVQVQPVLSSLEEDVLTWTVRAWECAIIGVGYLEVRAVNPDTGLVAKSRVIPCAIEDSVIDDEGPVPPEMTWVGQVLAAKDTAVAAKTAAEQARDTAQTTVNGAIAGIQAEGTTQVGNVNTAGTTQVGNVNTAGTTQVGAVQSEGATQVGAVQAKGTEVLNSIPSDYSTLSGDVSGLKSAVIKQESGKAYAHNDSPVSVTVHPNAYTQNIAVRYTDSENLFEGAVLASDTQGGITRTADGRFVKVVGTGTGGFNFLQTTDATILSKLAGKTINICIFIKKASGWGNSSYFAVRENDTTTLARVNFEPSVSDLLGWTILPNVKLSDNLTKLRIYFNSLNGTTFVDGDCYWLAAYTTPVNITDTVITTDPTTIQVGALNYIDTMLHESSIEYIVPTKEYVDAHVPDIKAYWSEEIYALPEHFGAVGDGVADDTQAIADCIAYAITKNKAIRGYGKYKINNTIELSARELDVFLKNIVYTGNNYAVKFSERDIRFEFDSIQSSGGGIKFERISGHSTLRNKVEGQKIESDGDCIYCAGNTYYATIDIRYLSSNNGNCITCELYEQTGEPVTEYVFRSSSCRCPNGYVAYNPCGCKFYDFTVEANCKYGLLNPYDCVCVGWRHREQIDSIPRQITGGLDATNGALIKFTDLRLANRFVYISSDILYWFSVDTSEIDGYDEISETVSHSTDFWNQLSFKGISINTPVQGSGIFPQAKNPYSIFGEKMFIIGGNKVLVPASRKVLTIKDSVYDFRLYDNYDNTSILSASQMDWGSDFIIDVAHSDIYLNASFGAVGYNEITVTQSDGNTCTVYDKLGNILFDGTNAGDGKWQFKCLMDRNSNGRYTGSTEWWSYDGTNEKWEITKIS